VVHTQVIKLVSLKSVNVTRTGKCISLKCKCTTIDVLVGDRFRVMSIAVKLVPC